MLQDKETLWLCR